MLIAYFALWLVFLAAGGVLYGVFRWRGATRDLFARLEAGRVPHETRRYVEAKELPGLPPPVQRFFRAALADGQPIVAAVRVAQAGTFNTSGTGEQWKPFTSTQRVVTRRPGFVWDARIAVMPGLDAFVHDAYVAGDGILHAMLFGLVPLANLRGTPEVAEGELMRYLAEAAWYPTALLPSQGVRWRARDDRSADATLVDGATTVTMTFRFDATGPIESVRAEARGRTVGKTVVPTPWEGRWSRYERREGMRVPIEGEVAWMLDEGPRPYWRGRLTTLEYEFAR